MPRRCARLSKGFFGATACYCSSICWTTKNLSDEDLKALRTMIDRRRKDKDKERRDG